jgi:hypothetical protein
MRDSWFAGNDKGRGGENASAHYVQDTPLRVARQFSRSMDCPRGLRSNEADPSRQGGRTAGGFPQPPTREESFRSTVEEDEATGS